MHNYKKDKETFDYLTQNLKESIKGWDYFINWDKVELNVKNVEIELNILDYLLGKEEIEEETKGLIKKYPEVIKAIPILVASREKEFHILTPDKISIFRNKNYNFSEYDNLTDEKIEDIVEFMKEVKILDLFKSNSIKSLVDYVIGVEVGLDTNGRKNRSGHAMENIVEIFISKICEDKNYAYLKEATPAKIKKEWKYEVVVDKASRRFDFVINTGKKLYLIETNYYGGGGSKLKSTAGEYKTLNDLTTKNGYEFIWITDGKGWLGTTKALEETFYHNNYILNLKMLEDGLLEEILK